MSILQKKKKKKKKNKKKKNKKKIPGRGLPERPIRPP